MKMIWKLQLVPKKKSVQLDQSEQNEESIFRRFLKTLYWLLICFCFDRKVLAMMVKALNSLGHQHLRQYFPLQTSARVLRLAKGDFFRIPLVNTAHGDVKKKGLFSFGFLIKICSPRAQVNANVGFIAASNVDLAFHPCSQILVTIEWSLYVVVLWSVTAPQLFYWLFVVALFQTIMSHHPSY